MVGGSGRRAGNTDKCLLSFRHVPGHSEPPAYRGSGGLSPVVDSPDGGGHGDPRRTGTAARPSAAGRGGMTVRVELPPWLEDLRRTEVVRRVLDDRRSVDDTMLGVPRNEVQNAIDGGQADFDAPYGDLSPHDRVLLYAYWNQRGHLEGLMAVFCHLFQTGRPDSPIIVDIGCGPFTGGLAIAATLGPESDFDYLGVDRSETMRRFGDEFAVAARTSGDAPQFSAVWAADLTSIPWSDPPRWRPVIVIVSYLFASPTLDVDALVNQLVALWSRLGRGEVTVLYTNSIWAGPNLPLARFHERLTAEGFRRWSDHKETIKAERSTGPKTIDFRCALWHRKSMVHYRPRPT